jgi:serralysin
MAIASPLVCSAVQIGAPAKPNEPAPAAAVREPTTRALLCRTPINQFRTLPMPSPYDSGPVSDVALSGDAFIDAMLGRMKWGNGLEQGAKLTYSFPAGQGTAAVFFDTRQAPYSSLDEPGSTILPLGTDQQASAADALSKWADVANLTFTQVTDGPAEVGDLRLAFTTVPKQSSWGWSYLPSEKPSGGDVWVDWSNVGSKEAVWLPGGVNYESMLHEIGHAIGLKDTYGSLPPAKDNMLYAILSYTPAAHDIFFRTVLDGSGHPTSLIETIMPDTPMLFDIAAAQYLYGANMSYHAADDVYTFDPHKPFFHTIWDAGGNDTISVANFSEGCVVDLRPGEFSSITIHSDPLPPGSINYYTPNYDGAQNLAVAYGVTIETAIGSAGDDVIIGNGADNVLVGGRGNDIIDGGAGLDTAAFGGARSDYRVNPQSGTCGIEDLRGIDGADTLTNIERLQFSDESVALDVDGSAGLVARVLAAVFGPGAVANKEYAGIGLALLDAGTTGEQLVELALHTSLGPLASNKAVVDLLFENVTGLTPSPAQESQYVDMLDSHTLTQAQLGLMAAATPENSARAVFEHFGEGLLFTPVGSAAVEAILALYGSTAGSLYDHALQRSADVDTARFWATLTDHGQAQDSTLLAQLGDWPGPQITLIGAFV